MRALKTAALCALLAVALVAPAEAESREYSQEYLETRLSRFKRLRTTGVVMALSGVGLVVLGGFLVGTAEYETQTDWDGSSRRITHDPQWPAGFLAIVGGVPLSVTGAILAGIGSGKVTQYERLLQGYSLRYDLKPGRTGASLAWRF